MCSIDVLKAWDYARTNVWSEKIRIPYIKAEIGTGKHTCWCFEDGCVSWLCIMVLYHGYVSWLCIMVLYHGFVSWLCIICFKLYGKPMWETVAANPRMSIFEKCFKSCFDNGFRIHAKSHADSHQNHWFRCIVRRVMTETSFV